ncbi:dihydrodipicolinate synthase family protein [Caenimonas terrae]|uniref:Dihydrodipicolinate synthase family protein n=1 Tax=Caenimonas terrae TaxID=696074 RepID=A0ABW0NIV7_9BURK
MALTLQLPVLSPSKGPTDNRQLAAYTLRGNAPARPAKGVKFNRIAYSAAHVVADPRAAIDPWLQCAVDWDATIAYRQHLWSLGLGVAEAMDTAQRGMGLDWPTSLELIRRSLDAARDFSAGPSTSSGQALVASGCGTDHLEPEDVTTVDQVIAGYEEQMAAIEKLGGKLVVMASRALARVAKSPADYERVYDRILSQARQPVVLHWLGEMFDPALAGYWRGSDQVGAGGAADVDAAMDTALGIIAAHPDKVDGIKISLLDKDKEIAMRRRLPPGVRMYTGDDFNYAELIAGDGAGPEPTHGKSDALLGIFDAIAPAASAALGELAQGNVEKFHAILGPTVPLSRHIFAAPTRFYKTGVVFMAWLNGHQSHFTMVGGQQSTRSLPHLAQLFRLADEANLLEHPELAVRRMKTLLALHGIESGDTK